MFTKNVREAVRAMTIGRRMCRFSNRYFFNFCFKGFLSYIYEKTRLPLVPLYGMFPVKMM